MEVKKCIKCKEEKVLAEYPKYKDRKGEIKFNNECKTCRRKYAKEHYQSNREVYLERAKRQREVNPEGYKEYLKEYYRANKKEALEKAKAYSQTDKGKAVRKLSATNYFNSEYGKRVHKARNKIQKALKSGKLIRPKYCSSCRSEVFVEAHHKDYSKPFEIDWLCKQCHENIHHLNEGQESIR